MLAYYIKFIFIIRNSFIMKYRKVRLGKEVSEKPQFSNFFERTPRVLLFIFCISVFNLAQMWPQSASAGTQLTWTLQTSGTKKDEAYMGVSFGNSQFVIVGRAEAWASPKSKSPILTSPDGINWTRQTSDTHDELYGVTWGNSQFVAVGENGTILTSPDGVTWTPQSSGTTETLMGIVWGDSQYVAVGGGKDVILTSPDGVSWTNQALGTGIGFTNVSWGNSIYVATGDSNNGVYTSPNGSTWTSHIVGGSSVYYGIVWNGSKFIAAGVGNIATSSDGKTWANQWSGPQTLRGISLAGTKIVAVGLIGSVGQTRNVKLKGDAKQIGTIFTSPKGDTWTQQTSVPKRDLSAIAGSGSQIVVVGTQSTILTATP